MAVAAEDGLVLTGTGIDVFEAKILRAVRKPFFLLFGLITLIFVILLGGSIFMNRLDNTVHNTDKIVNEVAGPEARKAGAEQQKLIVQSLIDGMDCKDQLNLQRLIDRLVDKGFTYFTDVVVVESRCQP